MVSSAMATGHLEAKMLHWHRMASIVAGTRQSICIHQRSGLRTSNALAGLAAFCGWRPGVADAQQGYCPSTHRAEGLSAALGHVLQDQRDHGTVVTTHIGRQTSMQLTRNLIILAQPFHLAINFGSLFHTSSTDRMPETHQASTRIDRYNPLNQDAALPYQVNPLPLVGPANCLIHHEFGDSEAVVHFRHLHVLRSKAPISQCLSRRCRSRVEPEEVFDLPQRVSTETIRTHLD